MVRKKYEVMCVCGSGCIAVYCCLPYVQDGVLPPTAVALMRSRYTAYVLGDEAYLLRTWHASTRPTTPLSLDPTVKWLTLTIECCEAGEAADREGWVSFVARYKVSGRAQRLQERSYFVRKEGAWLYVNGVVD